MSIFSRLFKKIEQVNKGESDISELDDVFEIGVSEEEAYDFWIQTVQNVLVNTVKAANNEVERAFVFIDMREDPSFEIFYQLDGQLLWWNELENQRIKERIHQELMPQAESVAFAVNDQFKQANHSSIAYAELQFEWASGAWFSHVIWADTEETSLPKEDVLHQWFTIIKEEIQGLPLDSDTKLSWYP